jgi:hypothetical protein
MVESLLPLEARLQGQQSIILLRKEVKILLMVPFPLPPLDSWTHESVEE